MIDFIVDLVNGFFNSAPVVYLLYAAFAFLPVFFTGSLVVKQATKTGRKRVEQGNAEPQQVEMYWLGYLASILTAIAVLFALTNWRLGQLFKFYFFYGAPAVIYMLYWLRKLATCEDLDFYLEKEEKEQRNRSNSQNSNIFKHIDINDRTRLLQKLETTAEPTAPILWIDAEREEDDLWSEHRLKARVSNSDRGMVIGAPGSGKTAFLIAQVVDWMQSGRSVVLTDVKPEIYGRLLLAGVFERYGYEATVFNPTDVNSSAYNFFSEIESSSEINEILSVIIPYVDDSSEVFAENARRLLKAVLLELGEKASLPNARKFINSEDNISDLLKILKRSENEAAANIAIEISRTAKNDNLLASIFTSLTKAFTFLDDDRISCQLSRSDFSLKDLLVKPKQIVIFQFEQEFSTSTATIFGALVAQTLRLLQANYRAREPVFVALDEIINCAPIPNLTSTLNKIRSAKMPTFLYFQSLEGLNRLYGKDAERLFMGAADLKVAFRLGDIETSLTFSRMVGETEAVLRSSGTTSGTSSTPNIANPGVLIDNSIVSHSTNRTTSDSTQILKVIEPEKFLSLENHNAVCLYRGESALSPMPCFYEDFGEEGLWVEEPTITTPSEKLAAEKGLAEAV